MFLKKKNNKTLHYDGLGLLTYNEGYWSIIKECNFQNLPLKLISLDIESEETGINENAISRATKIIPWFADNTSEIINILEKAGITNICQSVCVIVPIEEELYDFTFSLSFDDESDLGIHFDVKSNKIISFEIVD